jgi:polar amino acid transport system substrate-binding protein
VRARVVLALLACALVLAGCGSPSAPPAPVTIAPVDAKPPGVEDVTPQPAAGKAVCDREVSLPPGPMPAPGAMPPGSMMAQIAERGRLVVGVDQDTNLFGFRDPTSGQLKGFDVDIAREIARGIFGDPDRVDLRVVTANDREAVLQSGQVDVVVRTYSITCDRKQEVDFSTVYFNAQQRILSVKGSGIDSAAALGGKRVCAVLGTTSLEVLAALALKPVLVAATNWTDCLVMLQQGQVDAISTDDVVLKGLARQDPSVEVVGASLGSEPYGVGIKKENTDLVRFVNGVLDRIRADGTWERLYRTWLQDFIGPSPGPPQARYGD